jgi:SAM-dependent MidA family methyltransferase
MQLWLYGKEGYYKHFKAIGKSGDFYTAVSTSAFFGASIANHFFDLIQKGKADRNGWLIEIGAHQGYLISDMIQWLYSCDETLIETLHFGIVERQPEVQEAQRAYLHKRFGDAVEVTFFNDIAEVEASYAFIVANEILDAFPCELYKDEKIASVVEHEILWQDAPQPLLAFAQKHRLRTGEIAVGYEAFAQAMAEGIDHLDFVTFDYGEKYVRNDFSIRIYREHETLPLFDDTLILEEAYQKADITFDVNFAQVMDAFEGEGFETVAYETQARALVRFGVIDILEQYAKGSTEINYLREADRIKTLISPTIMGDRFKMLHVRK